MLVRLLQPRTERKEKMKWSMILLLGLLAAGCLKTKLNGWTNLIQNNPVGFEDAVNGSYYKDESNASALFIQSTGKYINELEYRLEKR